MMNMMIIIEYTDDYYIDCDDVDDDYEYDHVDYLTMPRVVPLDVQNVRLAFKRVMMTRRRMQMLMLMLMMPMMLMTMFYKQIDLSSKLVYYHCRLCLCCASKNSAILRTAESKTT